MPESYDYFEITNRNGEKYIHYFGYSDLTDDEMFRFTDVIGMEEPLKEIAKTYGSIKKWFTIAESYNQTSEDYDIGDYLKMKNTYFNGYPGIEVDADVKDLPYGDYFSKF